MAKLTRINSELEHHNTQQAICEGTPPATTDNEKAKAYYRMALACKHLAISKGTEKYHEADRNLIKARVYAPRDKIIEEEQDEIVRILKEMGEEPVPEKQREIFNVLPWPLKSEPQVKASDFLDGRKGKKFARRSALLLNMWIFLKNVGVSWVD